MEHELQTLGVDLRDVFRPAGGPSRLTARRVLALVEHPAEGGRLWASQMALAPAPEPGAPVEPPSWRGWTYDRQVMVGIFEVLSAANWQRTDGKGPKPKPLPRPETAAPRTTGRAYLRTRLAERKRAAGGG